MMTKEGFSCARTRAAGYYRVAVVKQNGEVRAISDQQSRIVDFCYQNGWALVEEYMDAGLSGADDHRPEFQRLIERATGDDHPFDVIVVDSYTRFFRDTLLFELYIRKLEAHRVRLVSVTRAIDEDDANQVIMRNVLWVFDDYRSKETSRLILRGLVENARQGFWNGATPPLGYRVIAAKTTNGRKRKCLAIDPAEAVTIKLIFNLFRLGDGASGPMGIKPIADYLNSKGYRTRVGGRFGTSNIRQILGNPTYMGRFMYNRFLPKSRQLRPVEEIIVVEVPAIIGLEDFNEVQALLLRSETAA